MDKTPIESRNSIRLARAGIRPHDWAALVAVVAGVVAIAGAPRGGFAWLAGWTMVVIVAGVAARVWSRKYPGPMPHLGSWTLLLPRGPASPRHLEAILEPRRGEQMLEIGPGIGVYSLPVASALLPGGRLDVLDVQEAMLEDLSRRATKRGIANIVTAHGDAQRLPYADHTFDAAFLVSVLGEIPDETAALRELRRVLKVTGRLVVGEFLIDPDFVSFATLEKTVTEAGFILERKTGSRLAYFARFRPAAGEPAE